MISNIRSFDSTVQIRFFLHFAEKLFEGLVVPFFVIYASDRLDADLVGLGLLVVAAFAAIFGIGSGSLADQFGRRTILVPCETIKTVALFVLALVIGLEGHILLIFVLYFVVALLNAAAGPVGEALTLDVVPKDRMKTAYSVLYWLTNLGRSIGTILGVILFEKFGFSSLVLLCSAFSFVSAWLVIKFLVEPHQSYGISTVSLNFFVQYADVFRDKTMMLYLFASTLNFGIAVQLAYYIAVRLGREFPDQVLVYFGEFEVIVTGVMMFGILRLQTNLIAIFGIGPMQKLTRDIEARVLFAVGPLLAACGFAVMMISNSAWMLIAAMAVYTISEVAYTPVKQSLLAQIATDGARARYAAVRALDFRLALMIGAIFVALSTYCSSTVLAILILIMGMTITACLLVISCRLRARKAFPLTTY